jgi:hypothetical protein
MDKPTGGPIGEDVLDFVMKRFRHSQKYHQSYHMQTRQDYDLFRGIYSGNQASFRNNVHIPYIFSIIEKDVATKTQVSFGTYPVLDFVGYGPDDAANAKNNAVLISAQMDDCDSYTKATDFHLSADIYGTAIARVGWKQEVCKDKWRIIDPTTNREVIHEGDVTRFDGPNWDVVDLLDFFPQPLKKRISDMKWVCHRYYMEFDDIKRMGDYGTDKGGYDKGAVRRLEMSLMSGDTERGMVERLNVYRSGSEMSTRAGEKYAKPVEIIEYWGEVPDEFASDGVYHRQIIVANGVVVLKNSFNPFWKKEKPFLSYHPQPDPHYFAGIGKVEVLRKLQITANRLANQKLDLMDLIINPPIGVSSQASFNKENLFLRPGRIIEVEGGTGDDNFRPIPFDMRGAQMAYNEIEYLWGMMQRAGGSSDDVLGVGGGGGRETARGVIARQSNVLGRVNFEAMLMEKEFLEPLGNWFRALNRQFLKVPQELKVLGSALTTNQITGLPMKPEPTMITLADINPDYRARAIGASTMINKEMKRQDLLAAMQAFSANPALLRIMNWYAFGRQVLTGLDFTNVNELFVQNQVPAVNQTEDGGGMGGGLANSLSPGATNLEQLNPGVLGGQGPAAIPGLT